MSGSEDPATPPSALDGAVAELERAAERLRAAELNPEEAAELVERCAELAAQVGREIDHSARAAAAPGGDQESLL